MMDTLSSSSTTSSPKVEAARLEIHHSLEWYIESFAVTKSGSAAVHGKRQVILEKIGMYAVVK